MLKYADTFLGVAAEDGLSVATIAAIEYALPLSDPYANRLSFTVEFLQELSEAPDARTTRLWMWKHGFTPKSYNLYDFEEHGVSSYVSDLDEEYGWDINEPSAKYLDDKREFYALLDDRGYGRYLPRRYGTLSNGVLIGAGTDFESLLRTEETVVVKGRRGATGDKVHIVDAGGGDVSVDGQEITEPSLQRRLSRLDGYLVTEYCQQAAYAGSVYPDTPNTVRIVTMNPDDGESFVASAVHRFGTDVSGAVDNFSKGGLSAEIRADGSLGPAVRYLDGDVSWHDEHPDTGADIAGTTIPSWDRIRDEVLAVARDVPELRYVGWDLVVEGEDEFAIIEGNSNTDTDLLQAHEPLANDARVRGFYSNRGIGN